MHIGVASWFWEKTYAKHIAVYILECIPSYEGLTASNPAKLFVTDSELSNEGTLNISPLEVRSSIADLISMLKSDPYLIQSCRGPNQCLTECKSGCERLGCLTWWLVGVNWPHSDLLTLPQGVRLLQLPFLFPFHLTEPAFGAKFDLANHVGCSTLADNVTRQLIPHRPYLIDES